MKFEPAIEFPVLLEGKKMKAKVLEEIDHPVETLFEVAFSDGFSDTFMIEDDGRVYGSGIASIPYARSIMADIGIIVGLDPHLFYYNYECVLQGRPVNIWVIEGHDEQQETIYKVYYYEFFRFALKWSGSTWIVSHKDARGRQPDENIVQQTSHLLNALVESHRNI